MNLSILSGALIPIHKLQIHASINNKLSGWLILKAHAF